MEAYVRRTDLKDGITEIEFFHPQHNALPGVLLSELAEAIHSCGKEDQVEVIILKSGETAPFVPEPVSMSWFRLTTLKQERFSFLGSPM